MSNSRKVDLTISEMLALRKAANFLSSYEKEQPGNIDGAKRLYIHNRPMQPEVLERLIHVLDHELELAG
jgi:hypothetical protein